MTYLAKIITSIIFWLLLIQTSFAQESVKAMTYNIRYDGSLYDASQLTANHWDKRKDEQIGLINLHHPDVVSLQEALQSQVKYFAGNLPDYSWALVEKMAITKDNTIPYSIMYRS